MDTKRRGTRYVAVCAFGLGIFVGINGAQGQGPEIRWDPVAASGNVICTPGTGTCGETEIMLSAGGVDVTLFMELSGWWPEILASYQGCPEPDTLLGGMPWNPGTPQSCDLMPLDWFVAEKICTANMADPEANADWLSDCTYNPFICGSFPAGCIYRPDFVYYVRPFTEPMYTCPSPPGCLGCALTACAPGLGEDDGTIKYGGTFVVEVPSCAKGTYNVGFVEDLSFTFFLDCYGVLIPGLGLTAAQITIVTGSCCYGIGTPYADCVDDVTELECDLYSAPRVFRPFVTCNEEPCCECLTDFDCNDNDACTNDWCEDCVCYNVENFVLGIECCNSADGSTTALDDDNVCTADFCEWRCTVGGNVCTEDADCAGGDDVCRGTGVPIHNPLTGSPCTHPNPCVINDECGAGVCAGDLPEDLSIPCIVDIDCPTGWFCNTDTALCDCTAPDCDDDGIPDFMAILNCSGWDPHCDDCNSNGIPDECDISDETSLDANRNYVPDECDVGACCYALGGTMCLETTEQDCADSWGAYDSVFLGIHTTCPTEIVGTATHHGVVVSHVTTPPQECPTVEPEARGVDCVEGDPIDPWQTAPDAVMCHEFGVGPESPAIPADFFGPGSDPFSGLVCLKGEPLGPTVFGEFGDADTLVRRTEDPFDRCELPSATEVEIDAEVVALSLLSTAPITVTYNGGQDPEEWDAAVELSDVLTPPMGSITAVKTHCNGGTYNSVLHVQPKFTFTKVGGGGQVVLDTGAVPDFPYITLIQDDDPPWISDVSETFGLPSIICTDFHPSLEDPAPTTDCDCNGNGIRDKCDIEDESSPDCQPNGIPDECDIDPNDPDGNGEVSNDCNNNGVPDECDIWATISVDGEDVILNWSQADGPDTTHYHIWRAEGDIGGPYVLWHDTSTDPDPLATTWADAGVGGDTLSHFYIVDAVDNTGATEAAECLIAAKLSYTLVPERNWDCNLISFPVMQRDEGILEVLRTVDWDCAKTYDPIGLHEWPDYCTYYPSGLKELWFLNHRMGFGLMLHEPDINWQVAGTAPTVTEIDAEADWNLMAYPYFDSLTVLAFKDMVNAQNPTVNVTVVEASDLSEPDCIRELADSELMEHGSGFWVRLDGPATITFTNDIQIVRADCNENGILDQDDIADGTSADVNGNGVPDKCELDVEIELVVRGVAGPDDTSTTRPESEYSVITDDSFVVEVWATVSGSAAQGLTSVYVDLTFDPDLVEDLEDADIDHRDFSAHIASTPYVELNDINNVTGEITNLGGTHHQYGCVGVAPDWARVAVVTFTSGDARAPVEFTSVHRDLPGIGVCQWGPLDAELVVYGSISVPITCFSDVDGDGSTNTLDIWLFGECLGLCEQPEPPWGADTRCARVDFDCSGCAAAGDIGWFAAAWMTDCDQLAVEDMPPCRRPGKGVARGGTSGDGAVGSSAGRRPDGARDSVGSGSLLNDVLIRWATVARRQGRDAPLTVRPLKMGYRAGDQFDVQLWVRDDTTDSRGLSAVFVDLTFDPTEVAVDHIDHGSTYTMFASGEIGAQSIGRLGGASLEPGVAVGAWTRFAAVRMTVLVDLPRGPHLEVRPAYDGVAGLGRGTISHDRIRVIGKWQDFSAARK
ncbi:MAG: hypothetical protein JSU63_14950 [Phycisphaerales bacterium]|nr:MAG: hypothetical protein JSU63_14950 [Phycisphaerales bacterium]